MPVKTNERELAGKVVQWFDEYIRSGNYPFTSATPEPGIKVNTKTFFGDVVIWQDRENGTAFSYLEIKPPKGNIENLETFRKKANALKIKYAFTWDFQNLRVYEVKTGTVNLIDTEPLHALDKLNDWLRGDKQATIKACIRRICDELENLHNTGRFTRYSPDKIYFVHLIHDFVHKVIPEFEKYIRVCHKQGKNKKAIDKYVAEQGIVYPGDNEFYKIIARQRVYGLATKIIFYLAVRKHFKELPDITEADEPDLNRAIKLAFAEALKKDWQAVFMDDPVEELGIPEPAQIHLRVFLSELRAYHFGLIKDDVIGELFEDIIEPSERHHLGQYFTNEDLVDLVIAFVVNDKDGIYGDPTCGSGTLLIRLYDRIKYLGRNKSHAERLNQIWGIDIAKFPAELSTINLFRQDVSNFQNFPRVIHKSIFDIHSGNEIEFPPPNAGAHYQKIKIKIPHFDALVGNFPFIRQELIEKKDKGFKINLTKLIAEEYLFSYPALFEFKEKDRIHIDEIKSYSPEKIKKHIHDFVDKGVISLRLSGQADIYAYIFLHCTQMLKHDGQFAIITSNAWLDVAYGSVLKQFFLDHFCVKAIIASWAESWFDDAAVNTIVTVLERQPDEAKRKNNKVHFVKLKKKLHDLIPYHDLQIESVKRWDSADAIVRMVESAESHAKKIDKNVASYEHANMRVRLVEQNYLYNLKGFTETIRAVFPEATKQICIVHQIRNCCKYVSWTNRRGFSAGIKYIYNAPNLDAAARALDDLGKNGNTNMLMPLRAGVRSGTNSLHF